MDTEMDVKTAARILGRSGAKKGGIARAKALTPERRREISMMGVEAVKKKRKKGNEKI